MTGEEYKDIDNRLSEQVFECFHKLENSFDASDNWYETSCRSSLEYWECDGNQMLNWKDKGYRTVLDLLQVFYI